MRVSVRDHGSGYDEQDAELLFNAFHSTKPDGMGVGLSISRSIIEAHGGSIWAENNSDRGATFHFKLPAEPPTARDSRGTGWAQGPIARDPEACL